VSTAVPVALDRCGGRPDGDGPPRWDLLAALGAATTLDAGSNPAILQAMDLPVWSRADATRVFVLELPPYASIHLGAEGKLGGDGAQRVAGMWRALDLQPPPDADHLASILALYAALGRAAADCHTAPARRRLDHARQVVLWEHLWSWLPGYLSIVDADPAVGAWARLLGAALDAEVARTRPAPDVLPSALREAPAPLTPACGRAELLDALTVPVRTGFVLTFTDLGDAARQLGVGMRRGERRFALRAMLEQDAAGTLEWLGDHALRCAAVHDGQPVVATTTADPWRWWAGRARGSAATLRTLAHRAARPRQ